MKTRHLFRCLLVVPATLIALAPSATRAAAPAAGTWTMTGSMHQARGFDTATLLPSGLVLVAGGCHGCSSTYPEVALTSAELYHSHTGSWAVTGSMHEPRLQFTATLLRDGRVLVVGGCGTAICTIALAGAELYNPHTGTWTATGPMHDPRDYQTGQTATLLHNGQVLVAGIAPDSAGNFLASAEVFHPRSGAWTMTHSMHEARLAPTATLLPDGEVLVAGGGGNSVFDSAELYQP